MLKIRNEKSVLKINNLSNISKQANNKEFKIFLSEILFSISKILIFKCIYKMYLEMIAIREKIFIKSYFCLLYIIKILLCGQVNKISFLLK